MMIVIVIISFMTTSCTENSRAKTWGGSMTINLEPNQKLVNVTWKDTDMWILTRPMRAGDIIETYKFGEKSTWGVMEGQITIVETGGLKPISYVEGSTTPEMDIPPRFKEELKSAGWYGDVENIKKE
jgi:hypothetical protein